MRNLRAHLVRPLGLACCMAMLLCLPQSFAEATYQQAILLGIEKKVETTPVEWVFDTVAASYDTVRYDLRVKVGNQIYTAEYAPPVQPDGPLPNEWQPDRPLQVRIEKNRMYVKVCYDREVETAIIRKEHARS